MNKKTTNVVFLLLLFCISCMNDTTNNQSKISLTQQTTIKIPIDSDTPTRTTCLKYYEAGGTSFLYFLNKDKNSIQIYDLVTEKLAKKIVLPQVGPNSVSNITGFTIKSQDSIYLSSSSLPILFLINGEGKILDKYDYSSPTNALDGDYSSLASTLNNDLIFRNGKIIIAQQFYPKRNGKEDDPNRVHKMFLEIDPKTKLTKALGLTMPKNYNKFSDTYFSSVYDGNKVVCSYEGNHFISSSSDFVQLKEEKVASQYINEFIDKNKIPNYLEFLVRRPVYSSLFFDKYRGLYYRIVKHQHDEPEKDFRALLKYPPSFSIMVFDKNLNFLNEEKLEKNKYVMNNIFVGKNGLYLSLNNPGNKDFDENNLAFDIYQIK